MKNEVTKITKPWEAYDYAEKLGKRVPELEPVIMKSSIWAYSYARNVIKGRWPEAEPWIFKDPIAVNCYLRDFPEVRTPSKDVPLVLGNYAIIDVPNTITDEQVIQLCKLVDIVTSDNIIKYSRTYFEPTIKQKLEQGKLKKINIRNLKGQQKIGLRNAITGRCKSDFE